MKHKNRILSLFLVLCMLATLVPGSVSGADGTREETSAVMAEKIENPGVELRQDSEVETLEQEPYDETEFVDGELLHHRGIAAADIHKGFGIALVEPEIRLRQHQRGAFPQSHSNGFSCAHAVVFGGDGLGKNHAGSFFRISANGGGDEAEIGFPLGHPPGGLPGKKRAVHINVENKPLHER